METVLSKRTTYLKVLLAISYVLYVILGYTLEWVTGNWNGAIIIPVIISFFVSKEDGVLASLFTTMVISYFFYWVMVITSYDPNDEISSGALITLGIVSFVLAITNLFGAASAANINDILISLGVKNETSN